MGLRIGGALQVDVTMAIEFERTAGRRLGGGVVPTRFSAEDYHVFIQHSSEARRQVLSRLGVGYLPGIWQFRIAGTLQGPDGRTRQIEATEQFVLDEWLHPGLYPGAVVAVWRSGSQTSFIHARRIGTDLQQVAYWLVSRATCVATGFHGTVTGSVLPTFTGINIALVHGAELTGGGGCDGNNIGGEFNGFAIGSLLGGGAAMPAEPTNLTAGVGGTVVTLTWTASQSADSYVIEAGSASGLQDIVSGYDTQSSATTLTVSAPPGTYFVRVRARNGAGTSAPSNEVMIVVGQAPAPPAGLTATVNGSRVTLSWSSTHSADSYVIEAGSASGLQNIVSGYDTLNATTTLTVSAPPGTYFVRVRARNGAGTC
jgi:hypothetical protein